MGVTIRSLAAADREAIREMLEACGAFTREEVAVALEVFDEGLAGEYSLFGAEAGGVLSGYVCAGKTPLTRSTWHVYWICVHPKAQRAGIGRALQRYVEDFIRAQGGERIALETSGRAGYAGTRLFYERAGYRAAGRIPDFYQPGDDCVMYCKDLNAAQHASVTSGHSPGKGRGLFAPSYIPRGAPIEEAPVVVVPAAEVEHLDRTILGDYYFCWGEDKSEAALLLGECSLCNHSFKPNAMFTLIPERQAIRFTALRDIEAGEEITVNYNGQPDDPKPLWFPAIPER
jgi:uncharacterized protein